MEKKRSRVLSQLTIPTALKYDKYDMLLKVLTSDFVSDSAYYYYICRDFLGLGLSATPPVDK